MINLTKKINLEGYTLILPSVAIGNVGQLSVDLLISNLNLEKIGQISSVSFIPIIGLNPYSDKSEELCTAIDIYAEEKKKIVVIQIRSPLVRQSKEFFRDVQNFVSQHKIAKVIVLTSSYAHEKHHNQFRTVELRYMVSPELSTNCKRVFEELQWVEHKATKSNSSDQSVLQIPGGGFAVMLYNSFVSANIPCAILFKFCSEGDNIPDAVDLVTYLNQWLKLLELDSNGSVKIEYPPSWKYLFGNPPSSEIY